MSQIVTVQEGSYIALTEAVADALNGKEDHLLSLDNTGKAVLFTGATPAVAVFVGRLAPGSTALRCRAIGKGGTVRMIQNAAITPGARVMAVNANARVVTATATNRSLGFKLSPTAGGVGEVIEVLDVVETLPA